MSFSPGNAWHEFSFCSFCAASAFSFGLTSEFLPASSPAPRPSPTSPAPLLQSPREPTATLPRHNLPASAGSAGSFLPPTQSRSNYFSFPRAQTSLVSPANFLHHPSRPLPISPTTLHPPRPQSALHISSPRDSPAP